jgi:hypothetical protein
MARTVRSQSAEFRLAPALKALLICLFIGGAGVGYVCQKNQLNELGRQKKLREDQLEKLRLRNEDLAKQLAERCTPRALEQRVKELNLGLSLPHPGQIVTLADRPPLARSESRPNQYAQKASGPRFAR